MTITLASLNNILATCDQRKNPRKRRGLQADHDAITAAKGFYQRLRLTHGEGQVLDVQAELALLQCFTRNSVKRNGSTADAFYACISAVWNGRPPVEALLSLLYLEQRALLNQENLTQLKEPGHRVVFARIYEHRNLAFDGRDFQPLTQDEFDTVTAAAQARYAEDLARHQAQMAQPPAESIAVAQSSATTRAAEFAHIINNSAATVVLNHRDPRSGL